MSSQRLDDRGLIVACAACGQKNRTVYERLGQEGVCGKCRAALPPPSDPIDIDSAAHFERLVETSGAPVVVDFWAPWCAPCRSFAPEIAKVAANARGRYIVTKLDTQALPELGKRLGIQSIPTLSIYHRGHELARNQGTRPAAMVEVFIVAAIAGAN